MKVTYTGLLFSPAIELSQLLNMRATDIDDLITFKSFWYFKTLYIIEMVLQVV
ncbi:MULTISPECIES: hypothetical protein [Clostridium]|uniref:Uncharacterized protein n=1 Tax=Clostridium lapidicellarium TaxID=3240931 RepID=A0ABV4E0E8_9CLOT|nr:hypothetical protein [uncultured Clostridium sp.]